MAWQFILTDLYGAVHGELTKASARKVTLPHLRVPSATCTIPMFHEQASNVLNTDCLLKAYRIDPVTGTKTLAFHGPVVSADENGEAGVQTISITAAGPFWRLTKRLIPTSKLVTGAQYGDATSLIDLGTIARTVLADVNGAHFTGIDGNTSNGALHTNSSSAWAGKWFLKNAAEAIAELAAGLNSFEHRVRPTEPTAYANPQGWPRIALFDVAPILGVTRPDAIFEYGTTRANVASYTRNVSRDGLLTNAVVSVSGWPDTVERNPPPDGSPAGTLGDPKYSLVQTPDGTSVTNRGLFEEVVPDAGVLDDGLRTQIGQFHAYYRKDPRNIVTFKPAVNARPAPFVDYEVGDTVRARAFVSGSLRFDALFRIWGLTFDVDENGNENVELELVMP
jgi:hypothetical protein